MDYSLLDRPALVRALFYPREDPKPAPGGALDRFVPVADDVKIRCRYYGGPENRPWILFFHGNGEVASDYDQVAPLYQEKGLHLVVAEFRGYGTSSGRPTFASLIEDAHPLWQAVKEELAARLKEPQEEPALFVMGRSMGSIPALEIASNNNGRLKGLIIESGFTSPVGLIRRLGLGSEDAGLTRVEEKCREKVRNITVPALVLHGEDDDLVPLQEAKDLYEGLGSRKKKMAVIAGAGHNDLMFVGGERYFQEIEQFTRELI